jgi:hypothetical protein
VVNGNLLDDRSSVSFKGQVAFIPEGPWSAQIILSGERDRDGDYALGDLGSLRSDPFTVARDFEGHTDRDVFGTTFLLRHEGSRVSVSSTTGVVDWRTEDQTDLDYTPFPAARRKNLEAAVQFTQEVRVASAATAPYRLNDTTTLAWQAGAFLFTQSYDQDAVNSFAPFVLSPAISFPVANHSPQAALDDRGLGVRSRDGHFAERLDLSAGLRFDREHRKGDLQSFFDPAIGRRASCRPNARTRALHRSSQPRGVRRRAERSTRRSGRASRLVDSTPRPHRATNLTGRNGRGISRAA